MKYLLLLLLSIPSLAQTGFYRETATNATGQPATVKICVFNTSCTPVTIYSDSALTQPITSLISDIQGRFEFFVAMPGLYTAQVTPKGFPTQSYTIVVPSISSGVSSTGVLAPVSAPSPLSATNFCPTPSATVSSPIWYASDSASQYEPIAYLNTFTGNTSPLTAVTFCNHLFVDDEAKSPVAFNNSLVALAHLTCNGTSCANQDRTLSVFEENPANDTSQHYAMEAIQAQLNLNGHPSWQSAVDGEVATLSLQLQDGQDSFAVTPPAFGIADLQVRLFHQSGPVLSGGKESGINVRVQNDSVTSFSTLYGVQIGYIDDVGTEPAGNWAAIAISGPSINRAPTSNYGLLINSYGTNVNDFNIVSLGTNSAGTPSGFNFFQGPSSFGINGAPFAGYQVDILGAERLTGNLFINGTNTLTPGTAIVASLPSAASNPGAIMRVSDSTSISSEGQTCVGSSTNLALAFSTGSGWKCF